MTTLGTASIAMAGCLVIVGTATASTNAAVERTAGRDVAAPVPRDTIGVASIDEQGGVVLMLRSLHKGMIAEGRFVYPVGHPLHAAILRHLGPIPKGGSVFVRPFDAKHGWTNP